MIVWVLLFFNNGTKGEKCQLSHFEALQSEGNSENSNAPDQTCQSEPESQLQSAENKPDNIGNGMLSEMYGSCSAKRPDRKMCDFEALSAERNADNGDAPDQTKNKPYNSRFKTNQNESKNVTDCFRFYTSPRFECISTPHSFMRKVEMSMLIV